MKLLLTKTSPYARKVRVVIREHEMLDQVQEAVTDYLTKPPELIGANPAGKIPALLTPEFALYDSPVICEYLDSLAATPLFPSGTDLWRDKTRVALGDALMDAAVALMLEKRRDEGQRSAWVIERERSRIERLVQACAVGGASRERPTMGDISVVCALSYLDLRHTDLEWPKLAPALNEWRLQLEQRPSFATCRLGQ